MADHGPAIDTSAIYDDEDVLERELRQALKSEGEIELFKVINRSLQVRQELANTQTVRIMLANMWEGVADFFESVTEAPTLAGLANDHELVVQHQQMKANFAAVGAINELFKDAREAEQELASVDLMTKEVEDEL